MSDRSEIRDQWVTQQDDVRLRDALWGMLDHHPTCRHCTHDEDARALLSSHSSEAREPRPKIVCLCGSTRFYDEFQQANYDLTMAGNIVLSVGFYPHAKAKHGHGEGVGHDSEQKGALDQLHMRKIDLADEVLVLNVGGYIGESTRREIDYAKKIDKPVKYLEATPAPTSPSEPTLTVRSVTGACQPSQRRRRK